MKVFFSTLIGVVVLAVVVALVMWSRLPDMLSNALSKKLGVAVSIESLGLHWGEIDLNKLQVASPPKSILSHALTCQEIAIITPFTHYINNEIVIEEIDLKEVYLGLEFDSATTTNGNWTRIMHHLKTSIDPSLSNTSRSVLIKKLVLTDIRVDVVYRKEGGRVQHLKPISRLELTNISSEGGFPLDQITNSVLGETLKQVFIKQNLKNMLQNLLENQDPLKPLLSPFNKFFGAACTLLKTPSPST